MKTYIKYANKNAMLSGGGNNNIVDEDVEKGWKLILSSYEFAEDPVFLSSNNIKHIVSILHHENLIHPKQPPKYDIDKFDNIQYHKYSVADVRSSSDTWKSKLEWMMDDDDVKKADLSFQANSAIFELYMYKIADLIEKCRTSGENVLVHCRSAVSRSPSVILAYYMLKKGKGIDNARNLLASKTQNSQFSLKWDKNHLWGDCLFNIEETKYKSKDEYENILNAKILDLLGQISGTTDLDEILSQVKSDYLSEENFDFVSHLGKILLSYKEHLTE